MAAAYACVEAAVRSRRVATSSGRAESGVAAVATDVAIVEIAAAATVGRGEWMEK